MQENSYLSLDNDICRPYQVKDKWVMIPKSKVSRNGDLFVRIHEIHAPAFLHTDEFIELLFDGCPKLMLKNSLII